MKETIIILFGVLFCNVYLFAQEQLTHEFFPDDNYVNGFYISDSVRVFKTGELYEITGDETGLYLEYGIDHAMVCKYKDSLNIRIELELYAMTDPGSAYGIYSMKSSGKGKHIDYGQEGIVYDYFLHFVKGNYYVRCITYENSERYLDAMHKFASFIDSTIQADGEKPEILDAFSSRGSELYQVKYFRGQLGLNNIFSFDHGSIAGFSEAASAREGDKYYFVFGYTTERKRREWFASSKGKIKMDINFSNQKFIETGYTAVDKNGTVFTFKPKGKYFFILRGFDWDEAAPVVEEMYSNIVGSGR